MKILRRMLFIPWCLLFVPVLVIELFIYAPIYFVITGKSYLETHNPIFHVVKGWMATGEWKRNGR